MAACRRGERPLVYSTTTGAGKVTGGTTDGLMQAIEYQDGADGETDVEGDGGGSARLSIEHDCLFGYATSPGNVAYRGALFRAFREVVAEQGMWTSWVELLHLCNARLSSWSGAAGQPLPSMEIASTLRGAAFAPADLVAAPPPAEGEEEEEEEEDVLV